MSTTAAIAAVTATLTNMIQAAVAADNVVSSGTVTARPPDRARQGSPVNQVNLFLYRTAIDAAWRNMDPPGLKPGESGQPPLPLVLSYLVTAYGENDDEILAHRLLGIAMGEFNDRPILSRSVISTSLPGSDLEHQVENVRLCPDPRPQDEISRMWATFGTGYRLSVSYDAAVVLIDSTRPGRAPAPVLMRGIGDAGPSATLAPFPQITLVQPPNQQPAARAGDVVTLTGAGLGSVTGLTVSHPLAPASIALEPISVSDAAVTARLPDPTGLAAGVATVTAHYSTDATVAIASNAAPMALAPAIVSTSPLTAKLTKSHTATLSLTCAPAVQPGQTIAVIVGDQLISLPAVTTATTQLRVALRGFTAGTYLLRLRVDAVDSVPVAAAAAGTNPLQPAPMQFDPNQQLVLT